MTHPCADHMGSCDHCYLCDEVGVCCASISAADRARQEAERAASTDRLPAAIRRDAQAVPGLPELVRREAGAGALNPAAGGLLTGSPTSDPLSHDPREEAPSESVPRTIQ